MNFTFVDDYVARLQPHVQHAAGTALAYAREICGLLADIRENGVDREPDIRDFRMNPTGLTVTHVSNIPAGESWILHGLAYNVGVAVQTLVDGTLHQSTQIANWGLAPAPIHYVGPCRVEVICDVTGPLHLQFHVVGGRRAARPTHFAGQREAGLSPVDAQREHSPLHAGIGG